MFVAAANGEIWTHVSFKRFVGLAALDETTTASRRGKIAAPAQRYH